MFKSVVLLHQTIGFSNSPFKYLALYSAKHTKAKKYEIQDMFLLQQQHHHNHKSFIVQWREGENISVNKCLCCSHPTGARRRVYAVWWQAKLCSNIFSPSSDCSHPASARACVHWLCQHHHLHHHARCRCSLLCACTHEVVVGCIQSRQLAAAEEIFSFSYNWEVI